jgi:hypothetical protein
MKPTSHAILLLAGVLGCILMQSAGAQVVEVTDPLNLFDNANDRWSAESQILPVVHSAACCDLGCDGGCDASLNQPSCDAMGRCCCRGGDRPR